MQQSFFLGIKDIMTWNSVSVPPFLEDKKHNFMRKPAVLQTSKNKAVQRHEGI